MQAYSFTAMCCFFYQLSLSVMIRKELQTALQTIRDDKLKLANVSRYSELFLFTPLRCPGNIPSRECMQGAMHGHAPKNASTGLPSFCLYHGTNQRALTTAWHYFAASKISMQRLARKRLKKIESLHFLKRSHFNFNYFAKHPGTHIRTHESPSMRT